LSFVRVGDSPERPVDARAPFERERFGGKRLGLACWLNPPVEPKRPRRQKANSGEIGMSRIQQVVSLTWNNNRRHRQHCCSCPFYPICSEVLRFLGRYRAAPIRRQILFFNRLYRKAIRDSGLHDDHVGPEAWRCAQALPTRTKKPWPRNTPEPFLCDSSGHRRPSRPRHHWRDILPCKSGKPSTTRHRVRFASERHLRAWRLDACLGTRSV